MNQKIWNQYKQTEDYRKMVELFNPAPTDIIEAATKILEYDKERGSQEDVDNGVACMFNFGINFDVQGYNFDLSEDRDRYIRFIDEYQLYPYGHDDNGYYLRDDLEPFLPKDDFRDKNSYVAVMALYFYFNDPFFKPILNVSSFYVVLRNCRLLGIELPELPKARDYRGAMIWYYDICSAFQQFQEKYGLSDAEFCACLYDLGDILHDDEESKEMPRPVNVWMTGASKDDYKSLEEDMSTGGLWQCNQSTRRGDIVVLYAVSPNSCIHSIWRADSEGSFNPFDYRQCRTELTDGVKITPIKLAELKADPVFGTLPMLNNNLQGLNGKMLPSWAYSALLKMIEAKGDDMSRIPVLYDAKDWNPGIISDEKDVEEKILIPALKDLGYAETDWTRQLRMKSGRKEEREIPDFVFFPHGERQFENAPFLIEAKYQMRSEKDHKDAYRQAQSYARMVQADIFGICDEESLIIYERLRDGSFDYGNPSFERHWAEISGDVEIHSELMKLIGSSVIKDRINSK